MLSSHRNKQPLPQSDRLMPLEKEYRMRRSIQLHTPILTSIPFEHCPKMPRCVLIKEDNLTEHLLEDITMIVAIQGGTLGAISGDEALAITIVAI
jgi:hypothetical protein